MARRRKQKTFKQIVIIGGALAVVQTLYIYFWPRQTALPIREAIKEAVSKQQGLEPRRKEQLKIQLAINDYREKNGGTLPKELKALVPTYFDSVPKDPETNQEFAYKVVNGKPLIGDASTNSGKPGGKGQDKTADVVPAVIDPTVPLSPAVHKALLESLNTDPEGPPYVYDPVGKRDPMRPFDFSPKISDDPNKTPLERYDVNQLKVTAILAGLGGDPSATVENNVGKGYIVKKGTKIGLYGGEVIEIQSDRILILETSVDFTGQKKTKTIELRLRTKDQEEKRKGAL